MDNVISPLLPPYWLLMCGSTTVEIIMLMIPHAWSRRRNLKAAARIHLNEAQKEWGGGGMIPALLYKGKVTHFITKRILCVRVEKFRLLALRLSVKSRCKEGTDLEFSKPYQHRLVVKCRLDIYHSPVLVLYIKHHETMTQNTEYNEKGLKVILH